MTKQCTISFITGHYYRSARRAGFHNLADAAHRAGFRVNFITAGYSLLSYLRRDYRTRIFGIKGNLNKEIAVRPNFISYVHYTPWHPMTMVFTLFNKLSAPFMDRYGERNLKYLLPIVDRTDVFIFESMSGLFLFKRFKHENPKAKMIYRVSDDLRILGSTHPRTIELEKEIAPQFDCVSVPCAWMLDIFKGLGNVRVDRHGLDKSIFDNSAISPYAKGTKNAVIVGTGYVDMQFIKDTAKAIPDCNFHIIGPIRDKISLANVKFYGEKPFVETVPYIKFADVGLGTRIYRQGFSASLTDSLKIIQYRYCGLPIVSPDFIDLKREGVYYYSPGDRQSSIKAMQSALSAGRNMLFANEVRSWDEVLEDILKTIMPRDG